MPFLAVRFDADAPAAQCWIDALVEVGALSVDVADSGAGTGAESPLYDDPSVAGRGELWPRSRLTALFAAGFDVEGAMTAAARAIGKARPPHAIEQVPDADWVRATQAQFGPLRVTDGLWIVPSWCAPVDAQAVNVRLDPGLAFGTGSHSSTGLCLRWLAQNLKHGARVLDYGCGSGVLAIAAAKLGAMSVTGVDVDAQAIATSRANAEANGVAATFGSPDDPSYAGPFDVVLANILADPLELLAPLLAVRVCTGGTIVLSGVLEPQAAALIAVYSRWFNIDVWAKEEDWTALAGQRCAT
jgi:ribosomal protein L11 methyltransferase